MAFVIVYAEDRSWMYAHGHTFPVPSGALPIPLWSRFLRDDAGDLYEWDGSDWVADAGGSGAPTDASYVTLEAEAGLSNETALGDLILRDVAASRPAAGVEGRLFYDTDNEILQRDSGVAWEDVGETVTGGDGTDQTARALALLWN